jgi:ribonuclease Z
MPNAGVGPDYGWGELLEVATFPGTEGHGDLVVKAFLVDHYPIWPAYGYRIEYAGKVVVISGDTESLIPYNDPPSPETSYWTAYAQNADVLVHEALDIEVVNIMIDAILADPDLSQIPQVLNQVYQGRGAADHHTEVLDVARAAAEANVQKLVLTHIPVPALTSPQMAPVKDFFLSGMDAIYSGPIILGEDGMDITVPLP